MLLIFLPHQKPEDAYPFFVRISFNLTFLLKNSRPGFTEPDFVAQEFTHLLSIGLLSVKLLLSEVVNLTA